MDNVNPNRRLLSLMKRHKLTHLQVAKLCRCGRTAVHYWTRDPSDPTFTVMSDAYKRLLVLELRAEVPTGPPARRKIKRAA